MNAHLHQQHQQGRGEGDGSHDAPQRPAVAHIRFNAAAALALPACRRLCQAAQPAAAAAAVASISAATATAQQQGKQAAARAAAAAGVWVGPLAALAVIGAVALQQRAADHACGQVCRVCSSGGNMCPRVFRF